VTDTNARKSRYHRVDLFGSDSVRMDSWTSTYTVEGIQGAAAMAIAVKGRLLFEEAVTNFGEFAAELAVREFRPRTDHHDTPPTTPIPGLAHAAGDSQATR
jgi:hypothetical protein